MQETPGCYVTAGRCKLNCCLDLWAAWSPVKNKEFAVFNEKMTNASQHTLCLILFSCSSFNPWHQQLFRLQAANVII